MGRGRQKAKHTKVARELKYFSPDTNYSELERELSSNSGASDEDPWAEYADRYNDEDDESVEEDDRSSSTAN